MFINQILGQEPLKEKLISSLKSSQIPHSQCFIDSSGRGGLALAVAVALEMLWDEESLAPHINKGKEAPFFLNTPIYTLVFPVATSASVSSKPKCSDYIKQFRSFVSQTPYGGSNDWMLSIGSENKQGNISVDEDRSSF